MPSFASLPDLKQHLNITQAGDDEELELMLDAAQDVVAGIVPTLVQHSVRERVVPSGGTVILRDRPTGPVVLTSLTGEAITGFLTNADAGLLDEVWWSGPLLATYDSGVTTAPAAVQLATLIIAGHLWETQRGSSPSQLLQGDQVDLGVPGLGYAIPNRARELLAPFMVTSGLVA